MTVEIRPHEWVDNYGRRCRADFFPFVDGEPRYDINCEHCRHFREWGESCRKVDEVGVDGDDRLFAFCGPICGYFEMDEQFRAEREQAIAKATPREERPAYGYGHQGGRQ